MTTLLAVLLALTHWSVASVVQAAGAALAIRWRRRARSDHELELRAGLSEFLGPLPILSGD